MLILFAAFVKLFLSTTAIKVFNSSIKLITLPIRNINKYHIKHVLYLLVKKQYTIAMVMLQYERTDIDESFK